MSLVISYPFTDLSGVQGVSGNGQVLAGASYPQGIENVLEVINGELVATLSDDHAVTTVGYRTEIYLTPDSATGENWYAWEFMLPSAYWADYTGGPLTVGQMHDSPDGGDPTRQPNFMFQVTNKELCILWPRTVPTEGTTFDRIPIQQLVWDRWYHVCVRINWQTDSTGFREVLLDKMSVYKQWNIATAYADTLGPYFKLGIYNTSGGLSGVKKAHFRNLSRWTGNNSYQTVCADSPKSVPSSLLIL